MSVSENYDANDIARLHGLDHVRAAFDAREMPWAQESPPIEAYASEYGDEDAGNESVSITASPFEWRDASEIPPRKWLYGTHLIRKFLSLDIAPGGLGKSSLKVVEALALCSGQALLGKEVHEGPHNVWLYNLEDPDEETERRLHAALDWYDLTPASLTGSLYVNSGRDQPLVLADETPNGARICKPVADALIAEIKAREVDVLIIDPFVSSHHVSENDNMAIDMVAKEWSRIADACNCSINLVHHVRKTNGSEVTAESSRGAVSLLGAARSVIVYNRMTKEEGERAGIPPETRGFHFRTQNDKANLAPPESADWHRMNNVDLPNGDKVGVACPWSWPDSFEGVATWHLKRVQQVVAEGRYRRDTQAKEWVGNVIADVLDLDPKKARGRINDILKTWIETEMLIEVEGLDANRKPKTFVEVGTWHTD